MTDPSLTESPDELLPRVTETQKVTRRSATPKAAGHPMTQIAAALGINNRVRGRRPDTGGLPPVSAPKAVWADNETAIHRRGLMVVKDRQQAWHLARGGVPVVIVDCSTGSDITVGRVKARWKDVHRQRTIGQLLPKKEGERLNAQEQGWLTTPVMIEDREADLPLTDPGTARHIRNDIVDAEQLARAVITQLL